MLAALLSALVQLSTTLSSMTTHLSSDCDATVLPNVRSILHTAVSVTPKQKAEIPQTYGHPVTPKDGYRQIRGKYIPTPHNTP